HEIRPERQAKVDGLAAGAARLHHVAADLAERHRRDLEHVVVVVDRQDPLQRPRLVTRTARVSRAAHDLATEERSPPAAFAAATAGSKGTTTAWAPGSCGRPARSMPSSASQ